MITVTDSFKHLKTNISGGWHAEGVLTIEGLSEGANTIPHGLGFVPQRISMRPGASGLWGETQAPDRDALYITVLPGGATSGKVDYQGQCG